MNYPYKKSIYFKNFIKKKKNFANFCSTLNSLQSLGSKTFP